MESETERTIPLAAGNACRIDGTHGGQVLLSAGAATLHLDFETFMDLCGTMAVAYNRLRENRPERGLY